jgi:pyridoxal phosphate enzyme (YggS family)
MLINKSKFEEIVKELSKDDVRLVAVSKTKPTEAIRELYDLGQRDFGENYVQEMVEKSTLLPADIQWHYIGHLQSNKVKLIVPFVHLIHGVDSFRLLKEINRHAAKAGRTTDVLLQVHIAKEETKFGMDENELEEILNANNPELAALENIRIKGFMGMASFTADQGEVRKEFRYLRSILDKYSLMNIQNFQPEILSMGMSADYKIAIEEGSNMVRIGSLLFGERR